MITDKMNDDQKKIYGKYKNTFPFKIVEFINELGIKVIASDMSNNISGSITKMGETFTIYINNSHASTRLRFTLAHELGHYFNDREYLESNNQIQDLSKQANPNIDCSMQKMDVEANKFAANLLMPEEKFKEIWNLKNTPEKVANFFGVTIEAVKIRASVLLGEIF